MTKLGFSRIESAMFLVALNFLVGACNNRKLMDIHYEFKDGIEAAKDAKKDVLLIFDFWGNPTGSTFELLENKEVENEIDNFTIVMLMVDDKASGAMNKKIQNELFGTFTQPVYYIIDTNGIVLRGPKEYCNTSEFLRFISGI